MAIVRWEPAGDFGSLQRDVNRLFSSFLDGDAVRTARAWTPAVDLHEHVDVFVLSADLPGVAAEDVAIDVERGILTLSGARTSPSGEESKAVRTERGYGSFQRRLTLPEGVDPDEIVASFDRGVLEVRIPKPVKARPRRISIDVGASPTMLDHGHGNDDSRKEDAAATA